MLMRGSAAVCPGVRLCRYQGVMVSGCADVRVLVCVHVSVQVSGCDGVRVCRYQGVLVSGCADVRVC